MNRTDIINKIISINGFTSYLEIGVDSGRNLRDIVCKNKTGVDPNQNSAATIHATSDSFFESDPDSRFDVIFIDGLHECDQVHRDIENSLSHLNQGGMIVLHDCLPAEEYHQTRDSHPGAWTGDVWKAVAFYFKDSPYMCCTVDSDWGCGIINTKQKSRSNPSDFKFPDTYRDLTWDDFKSHRDELLHVVNEHEFMDMLRYDYKITQSKNKRISGNKVEKLKRYYADNNVMFATNGWCDENGTMARSIATYGFVTDDLYIADSTGISFYTREAFIDIFRHGIKYGYDYIIYVDADCFICNHGNLRFEFEMFKKSGATFSGPSDGGIFCHRNMNRMSPNPFILMVNLSKLKEKLDNDRFVFCGIDGYDINNIDCSEIDRWEETRRAYETYRNNHNIVIPHSEVISQEWNEDWHKRKFYTMRQHPWTHNKDNPWGEPYYDIFLGYLNKYGKGTRFMYGSDYPFSCDVTGITSAVYCERHGKDGVISEDNIICLHTWFSRFYDISNGDPFNKYHNDRINLVADYAANKVTEELKD